MAPSAVERGVSRRLGRKQLTWCMLLRLAKEWQYSLADFMVRVLQRYALEKAAVPSDESIY